MTKYRAYHKFSANLLAATGVACIAILTPVSRGDNCAHCDSVLIKSASVDQYRFQSENAFFNEFLRYFQMDQTELEREAAQGSANANLAIKVYDFRTKFRFDHEWERLFRKAVVDYEQGMNGRWARVEVAQAVSNQGAIAAWLSCVKDCRANESLLAPRVAISTSLGDEIVALTASASGPLELERPRIAYSLIEGGEFVGTGWTPTHEIPALGLTQLVRRDPSRELVVLLRTNQRGEAVVRLPALDDKHQQELDGLARQLAEKEEVNKSLRSKLAAAEAQLVTVTAERNSARTDLASCQNELVMKTSQKVTVQLWEHPRHNGSGKVISRTLSAGLEGQIEFDVHRTHADGDPGWFFDREDDISYVRILVR